MQNEWKPIQLDIKAAFLYGELQELYMELPPGYEDQKGHLSRDTHCVKLNKIDIWAQTISARVVRMSDISSRKRPSFLPLICYPEVRTPKELSTGVILRIPENIVPIYFAQNMCRGLCPGISRQNPASKTLLYAMQYAAYACSWQRTFDTHQLNLAINHRNETKRILKPRSNGFQD